MDKTQELKEQIESKYKELITCFETASTTIENIKKSNNNEVMEMRNGIIVKLGELITRVKNEVTHTSKAMRWDNLVIAFFGETNAGKSTIIETFRILFDKHRCKDQDGLIVGDGQSDFTKCYNEYPLEIAGKKFTLIDVPGIEGNEKLYSDNIRDALRKAHCVFYVQGHNTPPNEATAKKIKEYLGDWVSVYSIQNVRGATSDYDEPEERETLLTEKVEKNELKIRECFTRILGDKIYKGNIPLQALLAMCSNASFAQQREDLKRQQRKLLSYFGSPKDVLQFSQFQTLINLIEEKSISFMEEIVEANKYKMLSLARYAEKEIDNILGDQSEQNNSFCENLNMFKREVRTMFGKTKSNLKTRVDKEIDSQYQNLKTDTFKMFDSDEKKDRIKQNIHNRIARLKQLPNVIHRVIENELNKLQEDFNRKIQKTPDICNRIQPLSYKQFTQLVDIPDVQNALAELDVSLDDIGNVSLSLAGGFSAGFAVGSFFPGLGNIIGGVVGAFAGGVAYACGTDGGKGKARKKLGDSFNHSQMKVKDTVRNCIGKLISDLSRQEICIINQISQLQSDFDTVDTTIRTLKKDLTIYKSQINILEYGQI